MLCLLIYLIAIVLIIGLAFYGVQRVPMPAPGQTVVQILLCVLGIILICGLLGWGYHLPMKCG